MEVAVLGTGADTIGRGGTVNPTVEPSTEDFPALD